MIIQATSKLVACATGAVQINGGACLPTGLPSTNASSTELQTVLQILFGVLAAVAVLFVVIGGFRYVISEGDPEAMGRAKGTIIYAVVGLLIALTAESIVSFALGYIA